MKVTKQDQKRFTDEVNRIRKEQNVGYMEAVVEYCKIKGIEPQAIAKLVNPQLKGKISKEAKKLNLLKK